MSTSFRETALNTNLGNHTPRPNRTAPPNRHAGKNDDVAAEPAVVANPDVLAELGALGPVAQRRVERVGAGVEAAVGADEGAGTEGDGARVDEGGVEVEEDAGAEAHVAAVVDVDGRLDPGVLGEE